MIRPAQWPPLAFDLFPSTCSSSLSLNLPDSPLFNWDADRPLLKLQPFTATAISGRPDPSSACTLLIMQIDPLFFRAMPTVNFLTSVVEPEEMFPFRMTFVRSVLFLPRSFRLLGRFKSLLLSPLPAWSIDTTSLERAPSPGVLLLSPFFCSASHFFYRSGDEQFHFFFFFFFFFFFYSFAVLLFDQQF